MAQVAALRKAYKYLVEEDDYHRWKMAANSDPGGYFTGLANAFSEFAQQFYEQQMAKQAGEKRVRAGGLPPPVELP